MTGNRSFTDVFTDLVNVVIHQKGGKRGIVKSVKKDDDKGIYVCDVDPEDQSAPIVEAKLTPINKSGILVIPKKDSMVSVIPLHFESEEENDWAVIQFSEVEEYIILAEKTVNITAKKDGIAITAKEKDINIKAKDNIVLEADKIKLAGDSEKAVLAGPLKKIIDKIVKEFNSHSHFFIGNGAVKIPEKPIFVTSNEVESKKVVLE